jgi:hypothetical protein
MTMNRQRVMEGKERNSTGGNNHTFIERSMVISHRAIVDDKLQQSDKNQSIWSNSRQTQQLDNEK